MAGRLSMPRPDAELRPGLRPGLSITRLAISSGTPFGGEGCAETSDSWVVPRPVSRAASRPVSRDLPVPGLAPGLVPGLAPGLDPGPVPAALKRDFPCSSSLAGSSAENRIGRKRKRIPENRIEPVKTPPKPHAFPGNAALRSLPRIEAHGALMILYRSRPCPIPRAYPTGNTAARPSSSSIPRAGA